MSFKTVGLTKTDINLKKTDLIQMKMISLLNSNLWFHGSILKSFLLTGTIKDSRMETLLPESLEKHCIQLLKVRRYFLGHWSAN